MITDENIVQFIRSFEKSNDVFCDSIEKYAHENDVPIIRKEMESFLKVIIRIKKPSKILEIGTAIGYSAIIMAGAMPEGCNITTIENYKKRIEDARKNIGLSEYRDRIHLLEGDALTIIPKLTGKYDLVFMDAAKGQYINYLKMITGKLNDGGVIISDNVLQEGDIAKSRYALDRRNRTIHSRMREYLYVVKNMPELETSIIPLGDGITISVMKGKNNEKS